MKQWLICLKVTLLCSSLSAQQPSLYFEKLTARNGLSHNKVNCIIQDQRGFIWLGTDDGLNRFDGKNFIKFRNNPGDSSTVSGNIINDIVEDKNGILWIATADGGLSSYNYRLEPKKQFKQYKHFPGDSTSIPVNVIFALLDDDNYLWLATGGHWVLRFDKKKEQFLSVGQKGTRSVLALCKDSKGILWAGREGGGLLKINPIDLTSEEDPRYKDLYPKSPLPHATVTALFCDDEKNIWMGSWDRAVYRYNSVTGTEESFKKNSNPFSFDSDDIHSMAEDAEGRIWMGGIYGGLHVYDKKTGTFYNYRYDASKEGTIADDHINTIFIDKKNVVWIGTNKGVSINNFSGQQFQQHFLPVDKSNATLRPTIYDFYEDEQLNLWMGTSNGLYMRVANTEKIIHIPVKYKGQDLQVTKFYKDVVDGTLYLGTNYSLFTYNPVKNELKILPNTEKDLVMNGIIDSRVVSIIRDTIEGHPSLLVSPYGHYFAYYDLVEKKWVSRLDTSLNIIKRYGLKDVNLYRKFLKNSGVLWLATGKAGLARWDVHSGGQVDFMTNKPNESTTISNNNVYDMCQDANGNFWVTTYGGGLHHFNVNTKEFTHIASENNLLEGLKTDHHGNVWMISNGNIFRYDPVRGSYTAFYLPDLEKSGGVRGYIYRDHRGKLYVAGAGYFISFHPDSIRQNNTKPKVYFTDFTIFNDSYSDLLLQKEIRLSYRQNYFAIEFSAPDFSMGSDMHYSYRLENEDHDWIDAGTRNVAYYSNVPGGEYIFKVRATNTPGTWSEETSIRVTIVPPIWKRGWFFVLIAIFVVAIVYAMYRYRINELLKRQGIRNKIAQDLHDSVGSTLSSISVYSQVAKIQHEKGNNSELKDIIQRIGITSTDMISEMNDIVWAINPRNDSMEKILQRMESFAKPLLQAKGISFRFIYDPQLLNVNLPMEKRKNFYLIFKEGVNNVLKYSTCHNLDVTIKVRHHNVELQVKDDGQGFDVVRMKALSARSLSGNGLNNMKRRAAEMKGSCWIESAPGKGTAVNLRFPIT